MRRWMNQGLLVSGALVCFGTSAGIIYYMALPELRALDRSGQGIGNWREPLMLFVFAFLWLLGGLIASILFIREQTARTGHPESDSKPWLAYREWASPVVKSEIQFEIFIVWLLALVAISITIGFTILARHLIAQGNYGPLMMLAPFALVGLGMLIPGINLVRQWFRFGQIFLTLDPYPGSIGGHVGGYMDVRLRYDSENHFQVSLQCLRKWVQPHRQHTTGSGMETDLVWQAYGLAQATTSSTGTRLSFRFDVPEDLHPSEPQSNDFHEWQVVLNTNLPGPDLNRKFRIPVFPTAQLSREIRFDSTEHSGHEKFNRSESQSVLKLKRARDGGVLLKYPMFKGQKAKSGLMLLAVGLGAGLPGIALLIDKVEIVGIGFSFIGLLFAPGGFYLLFHNLSVRIDSANLRATLKLLGIPIRIRKVARSDIAYLGTYMGDYVAAWPREGEAITISQQFSGEKAAKQALKVVCDWTGYPIETNKKRRERKKRRLP